MQTKKNTFNRLLHAFRHNDEIKVEIKFIQDLGRLHLQVYRKQNIGILDDLILRVCFDIVGDEYISYVTKDGDKFKLCFHKPI